jgi:hypothetical protein
VYLPVELVISACAPEALVSTVSVSDIIVNEIILVTDVLATNMIISFARV